METTPTYENEPSGENNAAVDSFMDTLRREHERMLQTIGHARSLLGDESGQLAHVAAIQGRLTRQFFDAQRSLLTHRAQADVEVARIGRKARQHVSSVLTAAGVDGAFSLEQPVVPRVARPMSPTHMAASAARHPSVRQEISDLGVAVVRTMAEVDSLAQVIDDAFETAEPDGAVAQRQLTVMLDGWWRAERQEARAVIDDAHARAAMRRHIAGIQAAEFGTTDSPTSDVVDEGPPAVTVVSVLPASMLAALDAAEPSSLHSLLDGLLQSVEPAPTASFAATTDTAEVLFQLGSLPACPSTLDVAPAEQFRTFWDNEVPQPQAPKQRFRLRAEVLLPITAVTSVLALVLAWIG